MKKYFIKFYSWMTFFLGCLAAMFITLAHSPYQKDAYFYLSMLLMSAAIAINLTGGYLQHLRNEND